MIINIKEILTGTNKHVMQFPLQSFYFFLFFDLNIFLSHLVAYGLNIYIYIN
jgi:hypothetical protein